MFYILAAVYFVMMFVGHLLLAKPADWHEPQKKEAGQGIWATIKTRPITNYIGIWLMFYINITCGLALISQEKMIVKCIGLAGMVGVISTVSAIFNAGYGGGFSNVPTLLSDHYGMGSISAIHGITLSAWAFAGLTGNQVANLIVQNTGEWKEVHGVNVNPAGYQNVLYLTIALYIVALLLSIFLVKPFKKDAE